MNGSDILKNKLYIKFKEAILSVLPITLIVYLLSITSIFDLKANEGVVFAFSAFFLILGIALFSLGADMAMQPMGEKVGSSLMKTKKINIIVIVCFILGLLITIAEPDLTVLANQVSQVIKPIVLQISIGIGVAISLVVAVLKIIFKKDLTNLIIYFYFVLFALAALVILKGNGRWLGLSFDSGGVTTGPITVPFIMALGIGVATTIGGRKSNENSFGLIALCSIGPIIAIMVVGLFVNSDNLTIEINPSNYTIPQEISEIFMLFGLTLLKTAKEIFIALFLVVASFMIIELIFLRLPKAKLIQVFIGILFTYFGLVIFLTAASVGYLPIGYKMGVSLSSNKWLLSVFSLVLGMMVVLAEPAIHVLTKQVEEITTGGVSKKSMLIALSIGVGIAILLSVIRIIFDFSIIYFIIPGYFISLGLSFFVPKIYTAIAFDSGGVASGPLTSSFILPFTIGACSILGPDKVLENAFGVVAMVAMTPLISIQLLGFKSVLSKKIKKRKQIKRINTADDEQIINFN